MYFSVKFNFGLKTNADIYALDIDAWDIKYKVNRNE